MNRRTARKWKNGAFLALSLLATLAGLGALAAILWTLISHGISGLSSQLFTQMTPPPDTQGGGLLNALFGSAAMTLLGILIGSPIGVLAGTYLAEYGQRSRLSALVRFITMSCCRRPRSSSAYSSMKSSWCAWGISRRSQAPSRSR